MIFSSLKASIDKGNKQPTFMKTVEYVSGKYHIPVSKVKSTVIELINKDYIIQTVEKNRKKDSIRVIRPDWKKIHDDGIWVDA